jgi:Tectonin domain
MSAQTPKRGAIPSPRSVLAAATPHAVLVGAPPNFITVPGHISMWGNDVHGDCVTAEEAFAKACNNPEIFIPDSDVISWATSHGVLEGAVIVQVLQWMQNDGFRQGSLIYDDGPYFSVNWTNSATLQSAISNGPVKIGVAADQLETAWHRTGGQTGWFGVGFHADSNEDHCVTLCGYGTINWLAQQLHVQVPAGIDGTKIGYSLFTWNSIGIIDEPSLLAITHEAWLRQPTTVPRSASGWGSPLPGLGTDISVGADGSVWLLGTNHVGGAGDFGVFKWNGTNWDGIGGGGVRIAVGPDGQPWLVNAAGQIFHHQGNSWGNPLPGGGRNISVGADGSVWLIGNNIVAGGPGIFDYGIYKWNGSNWDPQDGGGVAIAVGPEGQPWLLNAVGQIFHRQGNSWGNPLPGAGMAIGVGADGSVWLIGTNPVGGSSDYGIYKWNGSNWDPKDGGGRRIAVGPNGQPWLVNSAGNIYRRL